MVWKDSPEVFGNHFPHFRVEWSAGESCGTILDSSSGSSPRVLLLLLAKAREPSHDHTHLRSFVSDPDWAPYCY
jgi:hypothetical protein